MTMLVFVAALLLLVRFETGSARPWNHLQAVAQAAQFQGIDVSSLNSAPVRSELPSSCNPSSVPSDFIRGADSGHNAALNQIHATHCRVYVMWSYVVPELKSLDTSLSVAGLRANASAIYEWAAKLDWSHVDSRVKAVVAQGVEPIIECGEGTAHCLPKYKDGVADPNAIGQDLYLAHQYRFCRAAAHRFGHQAPIWQVENELNEAWLEGFQPEGRVLNITGGAWRDWTFLTKLLTTLAQAVHDEDSALQVTTNVHTDIQQHIHEALHLPGFYVDAVREWAPLLDIVSLDAYPNMWSGPLPIRAAEVGTRVSLAKQAAGPDKKVFVMETGYWAVEDKQPVPAIFNYSDALQAQYAKEAVQSVVCAGGAGLLFFKIQCDSGVTVPKGGYSSADIEAFTVLAELMPTENLTIGIDWVLGKGHLTYATERLPAVISTFDTGWGILKQDCSPRPAVAALASLFAK